ncbi:hypothetical protein [Staphylococcus delphini]|uniref:hypothetical protein n=1 Tax=Staphylococcus delphini TaxID=53344 RepID=UPI001F4F0C32|nr:hypothetical protein [Staphylococcus delphini]
MATKIYYFHFNYIENAYDLAYYHYWKSLEVSQYENQNLFNEFLEILDEPGFDIISNENIKMVVNKTLEKEPQNEIL